MITFTRAQEPYAAWPAGDTVKEPADKGHALTGEEAKRFYQSLIEEGGDGETGSSGTGNAPARRARRRRPQAAAPSERDGHRLLRCAQEGDLAGLRELLGKKGCNVNFCDAYYWTAIMCASYAGRLDAVRYLLHKGAAWVGVVDIQGRDARDLADQAGHTEVVWELDTFRAQEDRQRTDSAPPPEPRWCSDCGTQYSESEDRHCSSTLHQFSLRRPPPTPHYCLPPTNAGFRMMLREGWEPGAGLGPGGTGPKRPIRTVLKRDQAGLGYGPSPRARVTHFEAGDTRAVQQAPGRGRTERGTTLSRRAERKKKEKDKNWERDFRTYCNL
ncbi:G patch domain and ankyrin repeat-containing protein 1 [Paramormyrops kingsleyae]|uniref:G patch domain and ankyrin repeats 1 n=1 Tax=Paramormyrops kingsleyae TaxID=1676925 RepID=A0A3B3R6Y8_9TELE|nr:G patch domain and ankyrin repeat-containing protein 1 [Paramormyrops kingsleyae]XP_023696643.1 G patch domain and ankyrin repeat-containing protein 1 [Paramormyrops kingsleyae]